MVFKLKRVSELPGRLVTTQHAGPHPGVLCLGGLEWGLVTCFSTQFLGDGLGKLKV